MADNIFAWRVFCAKTSILHRAQQTVEQQLECISSGSPGRASHEDLASHAFRWIAASSEIRRR